MESKILELLSMESGSKGRKLMNKYRTTWSEIQEQMNEFALSHTVRYRDPLNKKRFAVPFKTAEKAKEKMDQLKRDGVKEIEITKDILRGKFKEVAEGTIVEDGHTDVSSSKRMAQVISEDAQLIIKELNKKSDEDELPTWWTNKLAVSAHNMNAARDYITNDIKESNEEVEIKEVMSFYGAIIKDINPRKTTYEEMLNSGRIYTLSNEKLVDEIIEYYKFLDESIYQNQENRREFRAVFYGSDFTDFWFWRAEEEPFPYAKVFFSDTDSPAYRILKQSAGWSNSINENVLENNNELLKTNNKLIEQIKMELKSKK